jgi:hypothetical protein
MCLYIDNTLPAQPLQPTEEWPDIPFRFSSGHAILPAIQNRQFRTGDPDPAR